MAEASRDYLNQKLAADCNFRYSETHLLEIAEQQVMAERQALTDDPTLVVCDTDLLVIILWSEVRFGHCHSRILDAFDSCLESGTRHYLLCDWDIPWQPDPLRENADSRGELFELYRQKLEFYALPYTIVSGDHDDRLNTALSLI